MAKSVDDLRELLFEVARGVKTKNYSPEQGKVIAELGQVMINTARVELDFIKQTGKQIPSDFIPKATGQLLGGTEE